MNLDRMAELWAQNKPLSAIGDELGVSRSTVAGLIDRARLRGDERFGPRPAPVRKVKPPDMSVGNRRPLAPGMPEPPPRLLIHLGWTDCRWPVGIEVGERRRHLFSGKPQAPGRPYCAKHCEKL